jgi:chromosome partitioning protein
MAIKIAVMNQKGGVGKSSVVHCLADKFRLLGEKVLVLDLDQQNNQKTLLNVRDEVSKEASAAGILIKGFSPKKCKVTATENVDLIHSGGRAIEAFDRFSKDDSEEASTRLKKAMNEVENDYDFILIDSSPTMTLIHQNITCYADFVIIPCDMDILSFSATRAIIHFIESLKSKVTYASMEILGILPVRYDGRRKVDDLVMTDLLSLEENDLLAGAKVFSPIRESANMKTTQARRKFISDSFPKSKLSEDFDKVAAQIVEAIQGKNKRTSKSNKASMEVEMFN